MSSHQFANIAPAPQGNNTMQSNQNQMSSPMGSQGGPNGSQVMSPGGQPMQQMPMGQFQIIQPQMGGPNTQYAVPQIATYNQQGQLVLQPANFAFQGMPQAAGGQQYIFTTAPPQMQPQKPGQQMIATNQQQQQGGKTMVPMTMGQAASYTITSTGMASNGGQQTFMIANPMGGAPIMATHQGNMGPNQMGQIKQENNKQSQQQQQQQAQMQAQQQAQQQPILVPQGMYMTPQGQTAQAIFQNGQIILRAPMQDGGQPQLMFSPPSHPLPQQPTMQAANTHQQLPPGMSPNMQPINMQPTAQMRPPVSVPSQPPPGKTQISRSLAPLLPTVSTSQSSMRQNYSGMPTINSNQTTSSPKSKQKVSPRSGGGNVGRPPGPSKSAVNSMKLQQSPSSMSPPCLPNFPTQPNSPMMQGPPVLQTSSPLVQPSRSSPHSQPPLLHPMMMLPTVPTTSGQDPTRYMGKPIDSQPPTLSASAPMPTLDSSKMMPSNKGTPLMTGSNSRKPDDKYNNGDTSADHHQNNDSGHGSQTPKAVVKPNVLTHVIDGHIIQESSQPFPLDNNSDSKGRGNSNHNQYNDEEMDDLSVSKNGNNTNDYNNKASANDSQQHQHQHHITSSAAASTTTTMTSSSTTTTSTPTSVVQGTNRNLVPKPVHQVHPPQQQQQQQQQQLSSESNKVKLNSKSLDNSGSEKKRGPGRPPGSTKQNLEQQKSHQHNSNGGDLKGKILDGPPTKKSKLDICDNLKISTVGGHSPTKPSSKSPTLNIDMTTNNPLKWSVTQVCDFVKSLPGCSDYVEDFQLQEIDGQALMLLKADHLMSAMAIKLGPALKICSAIDAMREELKQN